MIIKPVCVCVLGIIWEALREKDPWILISSVLPMVFFLPWILISCFTNGVFFTMDFNIMCFTNGVFFTMDFNIMCGVIQLCHWTLTIMTSADRTCYYMFLT